MTSNPNRRPNPSWKRAGLKPVIPLSTFRKKKQSFNRNIPQAKFEK